MIAVTSFSPKGYEVYGRKFLESAVEHWPSEILVYYEEIPDFRHPKVTYANLAEVHGLNAFLQYCDTNPVFQGRVHGYNYNYDAAKFARKAFAQFDALQSHTGKVFWLDADIVLKKPVNAEFLDDLFENRTMCALQRPGLYTESGFLGFDTDRTDFAPFLRQYIDVYRKGKLFQLRGWHDCYALDYAIEESGVSVNDLSRDYPKCGINVMPGSVLGEYMTHNKGNRKYQ